MRQVEADEELGGDHHQSQAEEQHVFDCAERLSPQRRLAGQQARDGRREQAAQPDHARPERKAAPFRRERSGVITGEDPDGQQAVGRGQEH